MPCAESKKGETPPIDCSKQLLDVGCEEKEEAEENINNVKFRLEGQV